MHSYIIKYINENDLVFDIGSNTGGVSYLYRQRHARVIAIEPNAKLANLQNEHYAGVTIENVCVTDMNGTVPFFECPRKGALSSCREDWKNIHLKANRAKRVEMKSRTLRSLIEQYGIPVYISIDVEGYESVVLRTLDVPVRIISIEYTKGDQDNFAESLAIFKRLNYQTFMMMEKDKTGVRAISLLFRTTDECWDHFAQHPPARLHGDLLALVDVVDLAIFGKELKLIYGDKLDVQYEDKDKSERNR